MAARQGKGKGMILAKFSRSKALLMASAALAGFTVQTAQAQDAAAASPHRAMLNKYCVTCHNERTRTADLLLDKADVDNLAANPELWEKVMKKVRTGAMPPAKMPRPEPAVADNFTNYLQTTLDKMAFANPNPGRNVVHRLNRAEYSNAVRDVLGVEIDASEMLPADDSGRGFDNLAKLLNVSPVLMERYMSAASKISTMAVGDPSVAAEGQTYNVPDKLYQYEQVSEDLPFGSRGGIAVKHVFPVDGEYAVKMKLVRNDDGIIRGLTGTPHQLDVRLDGVRVGQFAVGGKRFGESGPEHNRNGTFYRGHPDQTAYEFMADDELIARFSAKAGEHGVGAAFRAKAGEPEGLLENFPPPMTPDIGDWKGGDPAIASITIDGPFTAKGISETPSRQKIFTCHPSAEAEQDACAKKILSSLARRAYRRPVTDKDVAALSKLYAAGKADGGFESGVRMAIQGILVSPEFLFRIERDPAGMAPETTYQLSDIDLASRLSFFLWSSIPDEELLSMAEKGKLHDSEVLDAQVKRMMADPKAAALVENFAGQWLYLRNLSMVSPDPGVFPDFDDNLRKAFQKETSLFFESMLREDRSMLDLLRADYTYVNERLARHYGMPGIYGSSFRRVTIADEARKGLLGQGSILTVTSRPARTSPVLRGKWVLENILGTPPPPPPPDVPPLEEKGEKVANRSMRERMTDHQKNPVCSNCHSRMDPIGFALDSYNGIGQWRTEDNGAKIDAAVAMPDGTKFTGPDGLKKVLLSKPEQFVETLTEKMMTYALGRELEYYDMPMVRKVVEGAKAKDFRFSSIITGIVKSTPFQMRRTSAT
jgi:hypothetical protein